MENKKSNLRERFTAARVRNWICTGALFITLGFLGGVLFQNGRLAGGLGAANMKLLNDAAAIVKDYSVENYTPAQLADLMLAGMAGGMDDDYSQYFTAEQLKAYNDGKSGIINGGIGVVLELQENAPPKITEVYPDSPAKAAGLQVGDLLVMVGDTDITNADMDAIKKLVSGEVGTKVHLTVERGGVRSAYDVTRAVIVLPMAEYRMLAESNLMYIHILSFNGNAYELFKQALTQAETQKAAGLVIDIRDNLGGDLGVFVQIVDELLPEGRVFYAKNRQGAVFSEQFSGASHTSLPFAVLVNNMSASASEAFAGAIRDFNAAPIIGIKTYGKGIMQTTYPLPNGGAFKLTVAKYYLPKGECIHKVGITPDYIMELPDGNTSRPADMTDQQDTQLQKAIQLLTAKT